jgi:FKBP-type peptidyl-prolyl cis-trans isomerase
VPPDLAAPIRIAQEKFHMKRLVFLAALVCFAASAAAEDVDPLATPHQKYSYGMGLRLADMLRSQGMEDLDIDAVALALRDRFGGAEPRLDSDELAAAYAAYQEDLMAAREVDATKNAEEGAAFLAENGSREGVQTLESGLQYAVIEAGAGDPPAASDTVVVHYRGRLLDGSEFDSSYSRGQPAEFGVGQVISGWQEALQLMPVGAKWEVWIPHDLAYGANGAGAAIGPNATLHFDIELLEIK